MTDASEDGHCHTKNSHGHCSGHPAPLGMPRQGPTESSTPRLQPDLMFVSVALLFLENPKVIQRLAVGQPQHTLVQMKCSSSLLLLTYALQVSV